MRSKKDCQEVNKAWTLFQNTRRIAGLNADYTSWAEISRGLLTAPAGPSAEEDLRWDTAAAFSINTETPWDILRAQLLWAIWCQKVSHAFKEEHFHLGVILWQAWRNTIYCAMEAYKELFRHKRNEEKRQEMISCFQQIWTAANLFGRLGGSGIRWNLTPHPEFLPRDLGAWIIPPIRVNKLSPSPDVEAEFTARADFAELVQDFVHGIGDNWQASSPTPTRQTETATPEGELPEADFAAQTDTRGLHNSQTHTSTHGAHRGQQTPTTSDGNISNYQDHDDTENQAPQAQQVIKSIVPAKRVRKRPLGENSTAGNSQHTSSHINGAVGSGIISTSEEQRAPSKRHKTRCRFGPLKGPGKHPARDHTQLLSLTNGSNALRLTRKSRNKKRCTFGPKKTITHKTCQQSLTQELANETSSASPKDGPQPGTTPPNQGNPLVDRPSPVRDHMRDTSSR